MNSFETFKEQLEEAIFVEEVLPSRADVIFVPGNGYPNMAKRAAELYREGRASWILPSGRYSIGKGFFEPLSPECERYGSDFETEWEFLCKVLIAHGVPEEAILLENQATYTYENAIFSRQETDKARLEVRSAILCCKNYHCRRALLYYQLLYPETIFYPVPVCVDGITKENWVQSEEGICQVIGEVERILRQFSLMLGRK